MHILDAYFSCGIFSRLFIKYKFYIENSSILEVIASIDYCDKTDIHMDFEWYDLREPIRTRHSYSERKYKIYAKEIILNETIDEGHILKIFGDLDLNAQLDQDKIDSDDETFNIDTLNLKVIELDNIQIIDNFDNYYYENANNDD